VAFDRHPSLSHWGAFTALVEEGRVVGAEPFALDPQPSPMLEAIPAMVHSPLRVQRPAVREGWLRDRRRSDGARRGREAFVEVPWDTALALVAEEIARVRGEHGDASIFGGSYGWASAGRLHHARTLCRRFLFSGGGCTDQVGNYSWGAAQFVLPHIIGTFEPVTGRVTDWNSVLAHTRVVLAFGGLRVSNTQVTSGGAGRHELSTWLAKAVESGIRFVVASPSRADLPAGIGGEWLPVRPNTDTALMLAMCHVLVMERLVDRPFVERWCEGYERFSTYILGADDGVPKTPEWASAITGVPADAIRALARRLAETRSLITVAWSLQRADRGEQPYWAAIALAAMLGQIGLPGGGFAFGHGSMNGVGVPRADVPGPEMGTGGKNPAGRTIPVARIADMLENPLGAYDFDGVRHYYPDIRLVYWAGGNPFHHHQDLNRLRRAWARPEAIVVHESWWTPTARHADIVLPATTTLERNDVGGSTRDRFVFAMHQAIKPVASSRNDFDIFRELSARAGHEEAFTEGRSEMQWLLRIYEGVRRGARERGIRLPEFDAFWRAGWCEVPASERDFVLFEAFREDPEKHPLRTPSGRIELYSATVAGFGYEDCPGHAAWLPPAEWLGAPEAARHPLHLVTSQPADRLHAQMDPGPVSRANKVADREALRMHPRDAAARGIAAGDVVRMFNDRGACLAGAVLDDGLVEGVVAMATGAWYDPDADGLDRHGNANVLSRDAGTSRLAQGPSALSALVQVERWDAPAPPIEVHRPPQFAAA
jgi:biotin/methionine sulfoxide reductase